MRGNSLILSDRLVSMDWRVMNCMAWIPHRNITFYDIPFCAVNVRVTNEWTFNFICGKTDISETNNCSGVDDVEAVILVLKTRNGNSLLPLPHSLLGRLLLALVSSLGAADYLSLPCAESFPKLFCIISTGKCRIYRISR
jgi:hypothetical protein